MSSFRLATRYAKSLLQLAQEQGKLAQVSSDMQLLENSFEGSRELRVFLKSPIVHTDKKLEVFNKLFGGKIDELTHKFITLLTKKGREGFLNEIATSFETQFNEFNKITPVKITSATKLDKATIDKLLSGLKSKENLSEIQLEEIVDETLVGGFVMQYGDKQIDTSVRTSLQKLKQLVDDDSYVKKYA